MSTARLRHGMGAVGGKIYIAGGEDGSGSKTVLSSAEMYDPSTNAWSSIANMGTARQDHGMAAVGGKIYVAGGKDASYTKLSSAQAYAP